MQHDPILDFFLVAYSSFVVVYFSAVFLESALSLLQSLGAAFKALCKYELVQAVRLFRALPAQHKESSWTLHHSALAFVFGEKFKEVSGPEHLCSVSKKSMLVRYFDQIIHKLRDSISYKRNKISCFF